MTYKELCDVNLFALEYNVKPLIFSFTIALSGEKSAHFCRYSAPVNDF